MSVNVKWILGLVVAQCFNVSVLNLVYAGGPGGSQSGTGVDPATVLPPELFAGSGKIFDQLSLRDLQACRGVSREWKDLADANLNTRSKKAAREIMKLLNTKSLEKNISESTGVVVMRFISDEQYSYLMGQDALEQNYEEVVDYYAHSPDYPKVSQDSMTEYAKRLNNKLAELWPIAFSKPFPGLMICTPYGGQQYFEDFIYASSPELVWTRAVNNEFNRKHVAEFVARGKKIHVSSGSEGQYEDDDGKWIRPCWPSPTLRNQVKINRDELSGREASDSE